jgi:hypothetical protein
MENSNKVSVETKKGEMQVINLNPQTEEERTILEILNGKEGNKAIDILNRCIEVVGYKTMFIFKY